MSGYFLHSDFLHLFLKVLAAFGEVHGPTITDDGVLGLGLIESPVSLKLDYRRTLIPPKKYLLPPREAILNYAPAEGYRLPPPSERNIVLFGLHRCDLAGIAYLDKVFTMKEPDPLYLKKRQNLILIGLSCEPDEFCFCGEMGLGEPPPFDLYLHRAEKGFLVAVGSRRGEQIIAVISPHLTEHELPPLSQAACGIEGGLLDACARGETFHNSALWDDFASRCLSCGACSLCCPTCYCFDVREYGSLDGKTAERLREWDNCLFTEHGLVAGGVNFRKSRRERFLYRYQHKYLGFGPTRGSVACVGCGRCREVCPVRIDLLELFKEGGYEKRT